jgi:Spy/CpxP family protein refolding chaperone
MKTTFLLVIAAGVTIGTLGAASRSSEDPLKTVLFPPEMVLHFAQQIELSDEQREFIVSELQAAEQASKETKARLETEKRKFVRLMQKTISGEEETLEALKRMLKHDNDFKVVQYRAYVRIKNNLTAKQRGQLAKLRRTFDPKKAGPSEELRQRLHGKVEKLKKGMQELADLGVSPEGVQILMQEFQPLISAHKFKEAEALLDKALKKLADDPF